MTAIKKIKENLFFSFVVAVYALLLLLNPGMAAQSAENSVYFIKEMLTIMPVIFVLTALLDLWVPKEKILRYLGDGAGARGIFLSFVVGSVSAGPIYAAFPMCVMLRKKGASVRNIVIILSAWAVIKVPMLLNEAKFLGLKFMAVRWVLTVLAILVFSWLAARMLKDADLSIAEKHPAGPRINREACMGCGLCAESYGEVFAMQSGKAVLRPDAPEKPDRKKLQTAANACPVAAIAYDG
jgi:uncharacterized membrane protein YraQ (UPF0718 family)